MGEALRVPEKLPFVQGTAVLVLLLLPIAGAFVLPASRVSS